MLVQISNSVDVVSIIPSTNRPAVTINIVQGRLIIPGGGGDAVWGGITGNLPDQDDLNTELTDINDAIDTASARIFNLENVIHHVQFDQALPTATWSINHNMGFKPNVLVEDSGGSICHGNINYVDNNNLIITFSAAFSGTAYLS